MKNFEEKYNEYIKELKYGIPYALGNKHLKFKSDFEHDSTSDQSYIGILWFLLGGIGNSVTEHSVIHHIIFFVAWIVAGVFLWIYSQKHKETVSDYFFYQYEYRKIIEERIERDRQRDIQNLLGEMFGKDRLKIDDLEIFLEVYEFELEDINYFYDRCLSKIKYESFDEKL